MLVHLAPWVVKLSLSRKMQRDISDLRHRWCPGANFVLFIHDWVKGSVFLFFLIFALITAVSVNDIFCTDHSRMLYSHGVAWFVARNGSRFVHASNVFIARRLYCRIVSSGRDDIYSEPPKNWTKMGANFWPVPTPWFLFYRPLWGNEIQRCLKQRQKCLW